MRRGSYRALLADDSTENVGLLLRLRLPWLIVGLGLGMVLTLVASRFEALLNTDVRLAFFIPVIVYLSDAVGTQTETIYVRNLVRKQAKFSVYFFKELSLGIALGLIFGGITGLITMVWLKSSEIAFTVALAMFGSIASAAVIALIVPTLMSKRGTDPAVGAGPFTTVIQDLVSLTIYFLIASFIILH